MGPDIDSLPGSWGCRRLSPRGGSEEERPRDSIQADIERRFREMPSHVGRSTINNDEADQHEEDEALAEDIAQVIEVIDLTVPKPPTAAARAPRRPREKPAKRNPEIVPSQHLKIYDYGNRILKRGVLIEMEADMMLTGNGIVLRGLPLTRARNLRGQLPRLRNELIFMLEIDQDDYRPDEEQAAIEIPLTKVRGVRNFLITNKDFPEHRFPNGIYKDTQEIEERGVLICRWKCRTIWSDAMKRCNGKPPIEFEVSRMTYEEVPKERYRTPGSCLTNKWRGGIVRGGSFVPGRTNDSQMMVDVDDTEDQSGAFPDEWIPRKPGQQYTFGDMFCGAGGTSCGARAAGFRACNTYREEFREAELHEDDMYNFIVSRQTSTNHIDVLHLSPPCQYWSPAHTTPGAGDEANIAILFACHELVKIFRPRIFTVEQTYGILHSRFEYYFNALIHGFTRYGYSVRWRVANLLQWGAASQRQRLIIFGSCPGEELPPFPPATHSKDPNPDQGTKPYKTVRQILSKIPRDALLYDPLHSTRKLKELRNKRWNPDVPLARTITCGGGVGNYHYSGKRDFTLREYAVLQGFPVNYNFQQPEQKRQIGNAFPPLVVRTLYKHLRRWLDQQDRVYVDGELSESEDSDSGDDDGMLEEVEDPADDSEVEYLGGLVIDRNDSVQYLGGRYLHQQGSEPLMIDDSEPDIMEIDAMSEDVHSPDICIDAVQAVGNDPFHPIQIK
ncbi:S-adenosyl-L-methionine-dependent methyltransferase [Daldinia vernicosa]|uniref:S-adenosyl-L-methionine-dependent methyltransferase n=1 Tax=Daldinia vernicosa TaxID=114800 RepID=UPI002008D27E|nr:S-adenosyl-L-methionine-dependent methyltransferase [Daldinia vernicosa]KAI0844223.1 S-adenosyl-L-methionine-dependent methyltransferase [Daldinia vernicosa]